MLDERISDTAEASFVVAAEVHRQTRQGFSCSAATTKLASAVSEIRSSSIWKPSDLLLKPALSWLLNTKSLGVSACEQVTPLLVEVTASITTCALDPAIPLREWNMAVPTSLTPWPVVQTKRMSVSGFGKSLGWPS
jgi:hypothetical protein